MIVKTLKEAVESRDVVGLRYDNSKYWKKYCSTKIKNRDFVREYEYAVFLKKFISKKAKVLDVATGYGFLPVEMSKLGFNVECVDKYKEMIEVANKYILRNNLVIKIYRADATCLPMDSASYDLVTAQSILEHFCFEEMTKKLIPEIKRVTKKNGLILIHVPIRSAVCILKKYYRKFIKNDLPKWAIDDDGDVTHKVWMSAPEYISELLKQKINIEFIRFNFIRSNETLMWMKALNRIFVTFGMNKFYKKESLSKFKLKILSYLGTSVVLVCRNNSI
jgi:2-polyprenyl-3-methyl-5-hydroxy-6-metoxy-1,4-benzoquinol methylase